MKYFSRIFFLFLILVNKLAFSQINFQPAQVITTNDRARVVAVGDVNNDGLNDIVMAAVFPNSFLYVFLQDNFGGLDSAIKYPFPFAYEATSIVIDDINGDSLNDVVIAYDYYFGVFFQNSNGTLNPVQSVYNNGYTILSLKTGDLNNDGMKDIVTLNAGLSSIYVYYTTTSGYNFSFYGIHPNGIYSALDVGDVNGDSLDDVVLVRHVDVVVLTQKATGGFNFYVTYPPFVTGFQHNLSALALGDLNNDNRKDIVSLKDYNTPKARVVYWFQDTTTGLIHLPATELVAFDSPDAVEIADLNSDGKNEIIVVHGGWHAVTIYEQDQPGNYNNYINFYIPSTSHYSVHGLSIGDFNNDGKKDLVIASDHVGIVILMNNSIPIGIENFYNMSEVKIYPNPAENILNILIENLEFGEITSATIHDFTGRELQTVEVVSTHSRFDISSFSQGIYFLRIKGRNAEGSYKFIINR